MVRGIWSLTCAMTIFAFSTAGFVPPTLTPSDTYPCLSGGVQDTIATSMGKVPSLKKRVDW